MDHRRKAQCAAILGALLAVTAAARSAPAICNLIPGTVKSFNSTLGATNRPFAAPGERIELRVRPCDSSPGLQATAAAHVVTVVFTPPTGARHAVVLANNCASVNAQLPACAAQLTGGGVAVCADAAAAGLELVDRNGVPHLSFRFPDTDARCLGGPNAGKPCVLDAHCSPGVCDPDDDDHTLAGPARIAVTQVGDPLPCGLATAPCASQVGLTGCIDSYFANDGGCGTGVALGTFPQFTALPPPNPYHLDCFRDDPPCNPTAAELRFAVDGAGNLLLPVAWQGVLIPSSVPIPRLVRSRFKSPLPFTIPGDVFLGSFTPEGGKLPPIFEPQRDPTVLDPDVVTVLGSVDAPYSVLRVARRHGQCSGGGNAGALCAADTDCPGGSCPTTCVGAPNVSCTDDVDCIGTGPCGRLFDYGSGGFLPLLRQPPAFAGFCQLPPNGACTVGMVGDCPAVGDLCSAYAMEAQLPVTLESLGTSTEELRSFLVRESVDQFDRNGDGDRSDLVVTLRNRENGAPQALGAPPGCGISNVPDPPEGRAVVELRDPPFTFAALALEGDVLAFLESEGHTNDPTPPNLACDETGDGDTWDPILRVFRLGQPEVTDGQTIAVDPAPRVAERSLAVSNGLVFFRVPEAARGKQVTTLASRNSMQAVGDQNSQFNAGSLSFGQAFSADGRYLVFNSLAGNLTTPPIAPGVSRNVFVRDFVNQTTTLISVKADGLPGTAAGPAAISGDGRFVAFTGCICTYLPGDCITTGDTNNQCDIFVRDRDADGDGVFDETGVGEVSTQIVSRSSTGVQGNGYSDAPSLSADGRFVAFSSFSTNLVPGVNTHGMSQIYLYDRSTGTIDLLSRNGTDGGNQHAYGPSVSADGRFVSFYSAANNLLAPDTGGDDVFIFDRLDASRRLRFAALGSDGVRPAGGNYSNATMSADGRYIAFEAAGSTLVPGCVGSICILVHDRDADGNGIFDEPGGMLNDLVSVRLNGTVAVGTSAFPKISADGRFVLFHSNDGNLAPNDTNFSLAFDIFVRDRLIGATQLVSLAADNSQLVISSFFASALSPDGRKVAFEVHGVNGVVADDTNLCANDPDLVVDDPCSDIAIRSIGPPETCDGGGVDAGEECDGAFGVCPAGTACSETCQCTDLTGDGDDDDTVLYVLDAMVPSPVPVPLCAADAVAIANGKAAFLRPEAASAGPPGCAGGSLNADFDTADRIVYFWDGVLHELDRAATAVDLSASHIAALVSEADDNATPYNGDGDAEDLVVQVHPASAVGSWVNTGQAADRLSLKGSIVAFLTSEAAQGAGSLNADADTADRVLQVYDAATLQLILGGTTTPRAMAAEDFVVGEPAASACGPVQLVAFRTREAAEGNRNLNAVANGQPTTDADTADDVLQVYDAVSRQLVNTGQAVIPCNLDACDPRRPYRVAGSTVKFLTLEAQQGGRDLNGDGSADGLVLQVYDFCGGRVTPIGLVKPDVPHQDPLEDTDSSRAFVSPGGRCDTGAACTIAADTCGEGAFCEDDRCDTAAGRCLLHATRTCAIDAQCPRCTLRQPPTCLRDADCPAGALCRPQQITAVTSANDQDQDGVPDEQDNCPATPNTDQYDADADGAGDACDVSFDCAAVTDPGAVVKVIARKDAGKLSAKATLPLGSYDGLPVTVSLVDSGGTIAAQHLGALPAKGNSGKKWQYKLKGVSGVTKVQLRDLSPRAAGHFKMTIKAKAWFSAAAADEPVASTRLALAFGGRCYAVAATKKVD